MKRNNSKIKLSPFALNLYNECKRCFWLQYKENIKRPFGAFPSLPGKMDLLIKDYFDLHRGSLPCELQGYIKGSLMPEIELLQKWRHWKTGLEYVDDHLGAKIYTAIDDCVVCDRKYYPLDYKTRGNEPGDGDSEKYYQTQMDVYSLVLEANGYPTGGIAYLVYYCPQEVKPDGKVIFNIKTVPMVVSIKNAKKLFEDAVKSLKGPLPEINRNCEHCNWAYHSLKMESSLNGNNSHAYSFLV